MPLTDTDINPGQHNKMKKILFCLFFALVLFGCVSIYICIAIAFPCDTSETLCEILANKDSKIILYKRSGNATVAFHYVLYENEVNSDKIILILKDSGEKPKLKFDNEHGFEIIIHDKDDIIYLDEKADVRNLRGRNNGEGGVCIWIKGILGQRVIK